MGRLVAVTEGAGTSAQRVTTYGYDRKSRTRTVVVDAAEDGLQLCTTSGYDGLDNVVSLARGTLANPDQHVRLYEFDNLGRRVKEIAAPSSVFGTGPSGTRDLATQYRYDAAGRLTRVLDANGPSAWLVHDVAGHRVYAIPALGGGSDGRHAAARGERKRAV